MSNQIPFAISPSKTAAVSPAISRTIEHLEWSERHITLPFSTDSAGNLHLKPLLDGDQSFSSDIHFFGDRKQTESAQNELHFANIQAPQTRLLQSSGIAGGVQITSISGLNSTPLYASDGRIIGRFFEDADAKYCTLGDVRPSNPRGSRTTQTTEVLESIQAALVKAGMDFRNVVRTWFYNDDILDWYDEFNHARTSFFHKYGITRIPASTGIGASNADGTALVAKAIAVLPKTSAVVVRQVDSPLQREASTYGSAFSRAMEVEDRLGRTIYISGTASILPNGETTHIGNTAGQIEKTMEVVEAILTHNGMTFTDTTRAIAYFRRQEDIPLWEQYCRSRQLPPIPVILTQCHVCRDNLLFEIELDAARLRS